MAPSPKNNISGVLQGHEIEASKSCEAPEMFVATLPPPPLARVPLNNAFIWIVTL